ncbi:MAG TPA: short-chain dehydrogenase [Myxococcales bacterium]|nr:short-chain dehydrogenase [Deltaproteobacteria bacterium]HAA57796.1 short-chain dehydrogenase [Myxococcales bacterium]|tara:strand:- start:22103 stop:22867 length:765 start_codon:yes stop_codon:yes gene_type:complete
MADRLKEKVAIVSGGSRGIGACIARSFAREGAKVVITSRKQEALDETAASINEAYPGRVIPKACHIGHLDQIESFMKWVNEEVGQPTILVNNAATNPYFGPMLGISEGAWDKTFDVNLRGYFEMTRSVAQALLDSQTPGSIINVSSVAGIKAAPFQGVYGMTKAAILSMTKTLSLELGEAGIRVNAVAPGLVDTKLASAIVSSDEMTEMFTQRTALKRYAQPEELAEIFVYLASDEASYVTGQTFCVDGGFTIV